MATTYYNCYRHDSVLYRGPLQTLGIKAGRITIYDHHTAEDHI